MVSERELYRTVCGAAEAFATAGKRQIDVRDVDGPIARVWYDENKAVL
jgi:hypothetical protein